MERDHQEQAIGGGLRESNQEEGSE
jgi:hypothetical protein